MYFHKISLDNVLLKLIILHLQTDLNCLLELGKWVVGKSNHTLPGIIAGIIDKQSPFNEDQKAKVTHLSLPKEVVNLIS